jgi:hypothetical protein
VNLLGRVELVLVQSESLFILSISGVTLQRSGDFDGFDNENLIDRPHYLIHLPSSLSL